MGCAAIDALISCCSDTIGSENVGATQEAQSTGPLEADVKIADPAGHTVDEIVIPATVEAWASDVPLTEARAERFRKAGFVLGNGVAKYLRERTGLE
jgi:hypothetical protein